MRRQTSGEAMGRLPSVALGAGILVTWNVNTSATLLGQGTINDHLDGCDVVL
jgi:hypothetical protein